MNYKEVKEGQGEKFEMHEQYPGKIGVSELFV